MNEDVILELQEMKRLGMNVSLALITKVKDMDLSEYDNMSTTELASMLVDLY